MAVGKVSDASFEAARNDQKRAVRHHQVLLKNEPFRVERFPRDRLTIDDDFLLLPAYALSPDRDNSIDPLSAVRISA